MIQGSFTFHRASPQQSPSSSQGEQPSSEPDPESVEGSDIHRVRHESGEPAVTIHVYSPPPQRSGAYIFDPSGSLLRRSIPAAEELRPLPVYGTYVSRQTLTS